MILYFMKSCSIETARGATSSVFIVPRATTELLCRAIFTTRRILTDCLCVGVIPPCTFVLRSVLPFSWLLLPSLLLCVSQGAYTPQVRCNLSSMRLFLYFKVGNSTPGCWYCCCTGTCTCLLYACYCIVCMDMTSIGLPAHAIDLPDRLFSA